MSFSGNKEAAKSYIEGLNMLSSMRLCSNVQAQHAIAAALKCTEETEALVKPADGSMSSVNARARPFPPSTA
jgi:alanine-synthesizing transaminase